MPESSNVEHLVTLKTWMLMKEERKDNGIFQTFDMKKFFDKESLPGYHVHTAHIGQDL